MSDHEWELRTASLDGITRIGFLAMDHDEAFGLVLCFRDARDQTQGEVLSMWVHPAKRRGDVGRQLIGAVYSWAQGQGIRTLYLQVMLGNTQALAFYESNGYLRTSAEETSGSSVSATVRMEKSV